MINLNLNLLFANHWHQIKRVGKSRRKIIWERGLVPVLLTVTPKVLSLDVTTMDIEGRLEPDVVAKVNAILLKKIKYSFHE